MGKPRVIAETGAGQHGVATATICARYGLECVVYMGAEDVKRQSAQRLPHEAARRQGGAGRVGSKTLKGRAERGDARLGHQRRRHLLHHRHRGGPAPYPMMVRDFQRVIGDECLTQMPEMPEPGGGPPARRRDRLRRRRQQRDGHLLSLHRRPDVA